MLIDRAYKTELDPNNKQAGYFRKCSGTARFVYNWALADRIERYERGESTNMYEQKKRFNQLKREQFPWIYEVPFTLQDEAFRQLDRAYQNFFRRVKAGTEKPGFPKFRSKYRSTPRFTLRGCIHIENNRIKLPRVGWVRLKERGYLPSEKDAKINSVTISEKAGRWFISVQVEINAKDYPPPVGDPVGVDVGIKSIAVVSDGKIFQNQKATYKFEKKLARLQRELARRTKGGENWKKTKRKIQRTHYQLVSVRKHDLHEVSKYVTFKKRPASIGIENLNVIGMVKNYHLAKAITDASMSELHRQINYKAAWRNIDVVEADRFYPSTKTCSVCGHMNDMALSDRVYVCNCGLELDRDLNAARNLAAIAEPSNGRGLSGELPSLGGTVNRKGGVHV